MSSDHHSHKKYDWRALFICFALGAALAGTVAFLYHRSIHDCKDYVFVNRFFACRSKTVLEKGAFGSLEDELSKLIAQRKSVGRVSDAAVYFRDLQGGPVIGINEDASYSPASLLKLPLALTYMSIAEEKTGILDQKLLYAMQQMPNVEGAKVSGSGSMVPGQVYTVEELLHSMLAYSDNLAYYVLINYLETVVEGGEQKILNTLRGLGIIAPNDLADQVVSVHEYASIYRQLYNASFLNAKDSETVLSWLADSDFDQGLAAGVPQGMLVANKYGIRDLDGVMQLHDCGIIYYPKNPYLLCVMTRGSSYDNLRSVIRDISKATYEAVDARRKED